LTVDHFLNFSLIQAAGGEAPPPAACFLLTRNIKTVRWSVFREIWKNRLFFQSRESESPEKP